MVMRYEYVCKTWWQKAAWNISSPWQLCGEKPGITQSEKWERNVRWEKNGQQPSTHFGTKVITLIWCTFLKKKCNRTPNKVCNATDNWGKNIEYIHRNNLHCNIFHYRLEMKCKHKLRSPIKGDFFYQLTEENKTPTCKKCISLIYKRDRK